MAEAGSAVFKSGVALATLLALLAASPHAAARNTTNAELKNREKGVAKGEARSLPARMYEFIQGSPSLEFRTTFRVSSPIEGLSTQGTAKYLTWSTDHFRVDAAWGRKKYVFISDGRTLTIFNPAKRRFTQVPARSSIVGTMNVAAGLMVFQPRVVDFLWTADYWHTAGGDVRVAPTGNAIMVKGRRCEGYTIERFEDKWEVWIDSAGRPLPCRLISRRTDGSGDTVQTNDFDWVVSPSPSPSAFSFSPRGSKKVEIIDVD